MKEELLQYGLSEKEVEIYLACLKTGSTTSNRLSQLTEIRRSTVYEVIETLKKKGLVTSFIKDRKYYFSASEPESLIQKLKEKEELVKNILPSLKKLSGLISEKPSVELYEGQTSIRESIKDALNENEILVYGASKMGDIVFGSFTSNFAKKRVENKVVLKAIIEPDVPEHMLEEDVKRYTQIKTLEQLNDHNSAYFIYGNTLLVISIGEELVAVKIKNSLLAESQRQVFDILWNLAK